MTASRRRALVGHNVSCWQNRGSLVSMSADGHPREESAYWYNASDRRDQLARIAKASDKLAALFASRSQAGSAEYAAVAHSAKEALETGLLEHEGLKELARQVPARPPWLDPRNPGWNMLRDDWMDEVGNARAALDTAVLELRALASY